jgi:hypothetical protein
MRFPAGLGGPLSDLLAAFLVEFFRCGVASEPSHFLPRFGRHAFEPRFTAPTPRLCDREHTSFYHPFSAFTLSALQVQENAPNIELDIDAR